MHQKRWGTTAVVIQKIHAFQMP